MFLLTILLLVFSIENPIESATIIPKTNTCEELQTIPIAFARYYVSGIRSNGKIPRIMYVDENIGRNPSVTIEVSHYVPKLTLQLKDEKQNIYSSHLVNSTYYFQIPEYLKTGFYDLLISTPNLGNPIDLILNGTGKHGMDAKTCLVLFGGSQTIESQDRKLSKVKVMLYAKMSYIFSQENIIANVDLLKPNGEKVTKDLMVNDIGNFSYVFNKELFDVEGVYRIVGRMMAVYDPSTKKVIERFFDFASVNVTRDGLIIHDSNRPVPTNLTASIINWNPMMITLDFMMTGQTKTYANYCMIRVDVMGSNSIKRNFTGIFRGGEHVSEIITLEPNEEFPILSQATVTVLCKDESGYMENCTAIIKQITTTTLKPTTETTTLEPSTSKTTTLEPTTTETTTLEPTTTETTTTETTTTETTTTETTTTETTTLEPTTTKPTVKHTKVSTEDTSTVTTTTPSPITCTTTVQSLCTTTKKPCVSTESSCKPCKPCKECPYTTVTEPPKPKCNFLVSLLYSCNAAYNVKFAPSLIIAVVLFASVKSLLFL